MTINFFERVGSVLKIEKHIFRKKKKQQLQHEVPTTSKTMYAKFDINQVKNMAHISI